MHVMEGMRLGSTRNLRDTMHIMECIRLGGTRNLRDTMHVVEPHDATEIYGTRNIRLFEPRLLQPPRARIVKLMELLYNLYKYKNYFRC
jgi:hypothetical protein